MEILTTIAIGRHTIDFGVATTHEEREAILAQRFRVYQREGYYLDGVVEDRDEHDQHAVFFFAQLRRTRPMKGVMVGSARLIRGREDPTFKFPCQKAQRFELPDPVRGTSPSQLAEVGRVVSEMPRGFGVGQLVTTLGLLQAMGEYYEKAGKTAPLRYGLATIKLRLLRGLTSVGLPLYEIPCEGVIYPSDGPVAAYFHRDPVPVVPVYWLTAEMMPSVGRVTARYRKSAVPIWRTRGRARGPQRHLGGLRKGPSRLSRRQPNRDL